MAIDDDAFAPKKLSRVDTRVSAVLLFSIVLFFAWVATAYCSSYVISVGSTENSPSDSPTALSLASLEDALNAVRAVRNQGWDRGIEIELAAGVYRLTRTLKLDSTTSGTPGAPLVIRTKPGETAVIS